jgi:hypothetical protein
MCSILRWAHNTVECVFYITFSMRILEYEMREGEEEEKKEKTNLEEGK